MLYVSILFVFSAFCVPASILMRPDYLIAASVAILGIVGGSGAAFNKLVAKERNLFILLGMFAALSIANQLASGLGFSVRDAMILVRYAVYLFSLYAGIYIALKVKKLNLLFWFSIALVGLSIALSFVQYFNIAGLNKTLVSIYSVGEKYAILEQGASWRRIIGTMGNPNYWGFVLGVAFVASIYMCLKKKYLYALLSVPLFISIIMTGSRTTLIATILTSFVALVLSSYVNGKFSSKAFLPITLFACLSVGSVFAYKEFTANYYESQDRFSTSNLRTLEMRIEWWKHIVSDMIAQPHTILIGKGPAKDVTIRFGDNMYIRYLRDFGLVGLGLYLALLYQILKKLKKVCTATKNEKLKHLATVTGLSFVLLMIFDLAADGWFNVRVVELQLFCSGLVLGSFYKEQKATKRKVKQ